MRGLHWAAAALGALALVARCQDFDVVGMGRDEHGAEQGIERETATEGDEQSVEPEAEHTAAEPAPADEQAGHEEQGSEPGGEVPAEDSDAGELPAEPELHERALPADDLHRLHARMDRNRDGRVSPWEFVEFTEAFRKNKAAEEIHSVMEAVDTNKDGKFSRDELNEDLEKSAQAAALDPPEDDEGEEDHPIAPDEHMRRERLKFAVADADGDGVLDSGELTAFMHPLYNPQVLELVAKQKLQSQDRNGDGVLDFQEFEEQHNPAVDEAMQSFGSFDQDGDGRLSLSEVLRMESGRADTEMAADHLISLCDADDDGVLSVQELGNGRIHIAASEDLHHLLSELCSDHTSQ